MRIKDFLLELGVSSWILAKVEDDVVPGVQGRVEAGMTYRSGLAVHRVDG